MAEYMHLLGVEDMRRAAAQMQAAAEVISRAVGGLDELFARQQRFMDDWLARYEDAHCGGRLVTEEG